MTYKTISAGRIPPVQLAIKLENLDEVGEIARVILANRPPVCSGHRSGKMHWFVELMSEADLIRRRRAAWSQRIALR